VCVLFSIVPYHPKQALASIGEKFVKNCENWRTTPKLKSRMKCGKNFPNNFFFKTLTIIYWLCPSGYKLETMCCTQKCAKVWYPYILGSTGLHHRSVAQITRGLIHLGFIPHAKLITSMCFQFQPVEILSSL